MTTLYIVKRNGKETARTYVREEATSLLDSYLQGNQTLQFDKGDKAHNVTIETHKESTL
jgi:hypothetical protein